MKRIFLTGASSGIGLATAKLLSSGGHEIWGTSRDPENIAQLPRLHRVRLDLADLSSVEEGFRSALADAKQFDVVINNAGSGHFGPAESLTPELLRQQYQVLVFSHVRLIQLALAAMRNQNRGLIINVTSLASRLPVPFMTAYNSAKAAMAAFTMSMQLELSNSGIHLVDLQPADIRTDFNRSVIKQSGDDQRYAQKLARTWQASEKNMATAPPPDLVAREILALINQDNPPPRLTVGGMFQAKIAPVIFRVLPQRVRIWGLKQYYRI
jgi:NAD(P)-dependent dehydrogenase (short-subunit alcohol dehydrogenase family)